MSVPVPIVKVRPRVTPTELQFWWSPPAQVWVAGGEGDNRLAYSVGGMTWTVSDSGNSIFAGGCYTVSYGNGMWVAGGGNGTNHLAYSTDGINWTASSSGNSVLTIVCYKVAYGNGLWVAGGAGTNQLAYSTNGIDWTASSSGNSVITYACSAVAYGNGLWIAGGEGTNQMAYSTDGITWTASTSGNSVFTALCYTASYGNGMWVAGGYGTNQLAYSTDGMTWTGSSSGTGIFTTYCFAVSYANGLWVAGGNGTNQLAYSTDGMTWTASSSGNSVLTTSCYGLASGSEGSARLAQTAFNADVYDASGTLIPNHTTLTDYTPITGTVIIESIYNGTGKSLYLSGVTGATDTSTRIQDSANSLIGKDLSGSYMHGAIKEMLVYNTAHTPAQRKQVETYLKNKWSSGGYAPSGMSLWLDGATPDNFDLSGNRIQTWRDKSAHMDLSQNFVWAQPRYSLDSVTGRYGVQFGSEGMGTGFKTPSSPFGDTSSWSVFMVQRYDFSSDQTSDIANNSMVCGSYEISGNVPTFGFGTTTTSIPSVGELNLIVGGHQDLVTVEIHKRPVMFSSVINDSSYTGYYNGNISLNASISTATTAESLLNIGFTSSTGLGTVDPNIIGSMRGYIYEMIVYNRPVEAEERQEIEGYLAWKWGIQDLLATTHPYYIAPP